jgi:hypothetical protein
MAVRNGVAAGDTTETANEMRYIARPSRTHLHLATETHILTLPESTLSRKLASMQNADRAEASHRAKRAKQRYVAVQCTDKLTNNKIVQTNKQTQTNKISKKTNKQTNKQTHLRFQKPRAAAQTREFDAVKTTFFPSRSEAACSEEALLSLSSQHRTLRL